MTTLPAGRFRSDGGFALRLASLLAAAIGVGLLAGCTAPEKGKSHRTSPPAGTEPGQPDRVFGIEVYHDDP